ncbi:MAG: hypothetical protein NTW30_04405 [Candidatus Aenigmarchaeota archaeon]|jgi:hypothetical protein|nr:hypothetical protein [Candidatus Aenigmarchaeota archaeon]
MLILIVDNGFTAELPGLAKIQTFSKLSQKRITRAVRKKLREKYGDRNCEVSCGVEFSNSIWNGKCKINNMEYDFRVVEQIDRK